MNDKTSTKNPYESNELVNLTDDIDVKQREQIFYNFVCGGISEAYELSKGASELLKAIYHLYAKITLTTKVYEGEEFLVFNGETQGKIFFNLEHIESKSNYTYTAQTFNKARKELIAKRIITPVVDHTDVYWVNPDVLQITYDDECDYDYLLMINGRLRQLE